jgi:hypothetical protein
MTNTAELIRLRTILMAVFIKETAAAVSRHWTPPLFISRAGVLAMKT